MKGKTTFLLAVLLSLFGISIQSLFSFQEALQQVLFVCVGIGAYFFIVKKMHSHSLITFSYIAGSLGIILLAILLIAIDPIRGSQRWFTINLFAFQFALQPSVLFVPFWLVLYAEFLLRIPIRTWYGYGAALLIIVIPVFLIFKQPDLGTSLVLGISFFSMLLLRRPKIHYLIITAVCVLPFILFAPQFLHGYQLTRLTAFLDETIDPSGANYNSIQAIIAIGSGGFFGKGFFNASQTRLHFLPEAHTDFVFAAFTEMFGFAGSFLLITVGMLFLVSIARSISNRSPEIGRLFTVGMLMYLLTEWIFNIGMNLRLLPVVGVPLPLVSYGGTALLTIFVMLAMQKKFTDS